MSTDKQPDIEQLTSQVSPAQISVFAWQRLCDKFALATERICELEEHTAKLEKRLAAIEAMLSSDNLFRPTDEIRDDTYSL